MASEVSVITQSIVNLNITSELSSFGSQRRFEKGQTIGQLKSKLELITGCSPVSVQLDLYNKENKLLCKLDNNDALLGSYPVEDDMRIHAADPSRKVGEFEDVSKVEKFEISEEEYKNRKDTVRAFKERNKLGRFDPEEEKLKEEAKQKQQEAEKAQIEKMKVGDRCQVKAPGQPTRLGQVMHLGTTDFKEGLWVGVKYDEPVGKNDGSVKGKRYFDCAPKYGGFVKPLVVEVGDFPEEDLGFSDEDEI